MDRKKLPIGLQTFRDLREEKCYYVDKTGFAARLIDGAKHNFLSRPRRFGKSLFVDTLKNLFEGNKELFEGLAIYDKWDWDVKYPVLRLDFTGGDFTEPGELKPFIMEQLAAIEQSEGVTTEYETLSGRFANLIQKLFEEKGQRVVILVDEYDKPIYDALETPEMEDVARANRNTLRALYGNIKRCEENIRFSFLTGVTKFARAGIFSGINNLRDITLSPDFSSICGYTDHDIDTVFAPELEVIHPDFGKLDREEIKEWYNGYNWRGKEKIYNPFSILMLFVEREFGSWWYDTGTPTFLFNELKKHGDTDTLRFAGMSADNTLLSSFEIGNIGIPALLFQSGYLTILREEMEEGEAFYQLDFPNREVRQSLHQGLLSDLAPRAEVALQTKRLRKALVSIDFEALEAQLRALFSEIAYTTYNPTDIENYEGHYASNAHTCLAGTGLVVRPEDPTSKGRIDMTVEAGTCIYIFEFKVLGGEVKPGDAMRQLRDRRYADKYLARGMPVYLVGVEVSSEKRNIAHFNYEEA